MVTKLLTARFQDQLFSELRVVLRNLKKASNRFVCHQWWNHPESKQSGMMMMMMMMTRMMMMMMMMIMVI